MTKLTDKQILKVVDVISNAIQKTPNKKTKDELAYLIHRTIELKAIDYNVLRAYKIFY